MYFRETIYHPFDFNLKALVQARRAIKKRNRHKF